MPSKYIEEPPEAHIIYQPFIEPSMTLGIPSKMLYAIAFILLQSLLVLQTWKLVPVCVLLYVIARKYRKEDPYFDQVYLQYPKKVKRYR